MIRLGFAFFIEGLIWFGAISVVLLVFAIISVAVENIKSKKGRGKK